MDKIQIAKNAVSLLVGFGTGRVVKEVIENNTDPDTVSDKVGIVVGSYVLGALAADAAKGWTDQKIDKAISWWQNRVTSQFPTE